MLATSISSSMAGLAEEGVGNGTSWDLPWLLQVFPASGQPLTPGSAGQTIQLPSASGVLPRPAPSRLASPERIPSRALRPRHGTGAAPSQAAPFPGGGKDQAGLLRSPCRRLGGGHGSGVPRLSFHGDPLLSPLRNPPAGGAFLSRWHQGLWA